LTGRSKSTTFKIVCNVALMMRGPPAAPTTSSGPPSLKTIVGDMLLKGRLPG
jgi:hypothetical protein